MKTVWVPFHRVAHAIEWLRLNGSFDEHNRCMMQMNARSWKTMMLNYRGSELAPFELDKIGEITDDQRMLFKLMFSG